MYAGVYGYRVGEESETVSEWSGQDLHSCHSPRPSPRGYIDGIAPGPRGCDAFGRLLFVMHYRCVWPAAIRYALSLRQDLAAAIAPRRRKNPARRQFRPLGKAGGVMNPAGLSRIFNPAGLQTWFWQITNHAGTHTDSFRSLERKPDADCRRGRLFPRFRLASCSAAYVGTSCGSNAFGWLYFALPHRRINAL